MYFCWVILHLNEFEFCRHFNLDTRYSRLWSDDAVQRNATQDNPRPRAALRMQIYAK